MKPTLFANPIYRDIRGSFREVFKHSKTPNIKPIQWNISNSKKDVVRGMHYQKTKPQGKYITVVAGCILDVIIDLATHELMIIPMVSDGSCLYIPPGYMHGFWAKQNTTLLYGCTEEYDPKDEAGLSPLNPNYDFPWKNEHHTLIISEKDLTW